MSRGYDWDRFPRRTKRPPPQHGIKVTKTGSTWWGLRWLEALEQMSSGYSNRLPRGKTYARAGRTHDLVVKTGEVTARVTGSRPTPYKVRISLRPLDDTQWQKAILALAKQAAFAAELLAGRMPKDIDVAFREAGTSLFPTPKAPLDTDCSCPDWANPCKHVAATHYVLGEAFDGDPFLLFELRGRTKERVLDALRAARHEGSAPTAPPERAKKADVPTVPIGKVTSAEYNRWREAPPTLHLTVKAPESPGALLKQLGSPAAWTHPTSPAECLGPRVRAASERALRLALSDTPDVPAPAASPPQPRPGRRK